MKARCVVVHFDNEKDEILAIIDYNKHREKRASQYYKEIKELHNIYDGEALQRMKSNLKQYADLLDLSKRKEKDFKKEHPGLKDSEIIDELYKTGEIKDEDIIKGDTYKKARTKSANESYIDTLEEIRKNVGKPRSFVFKIDQIGKLAEKDKTVKKVMKYLDNTTLKLDNGHKIYRLRKCQIENSNDTLFCEKIQTKIDSVLEVTEKTKSGEIKRKSISNQEVKEFENQCKVNKKSEKERQKEKLKIEFKVVLIHPEDNFEDFNNHMLHAHEQSALFIIADDNNLNDCMNLMKQLSYNFYTYYVYGDNLLLLGTRKYPSPSVRKGTLPGEIDIYQYIRTIYSGEIHFRQLPLS